MLFRSTLRGLRAPSTGRETHWDEATPGLALRVTDRGVKTWSVWTRVRGRGVRVTLGRFPTLGLSDARKKALGVLRDVALGADPVAEKRRRREAGTFGDLARSFLKDVAHTIRPGTHREWTRLLGHSRLAGLRGRPTTEVTRGELVRLFDRIAERSRAEGGKGYEANRSLEAVRRCFNWAVQKDLLPASPCVGVIKPTKEQPRQRAYADAELGRIVIALDESPTCDAVRLCLFTGVRIEQALGAPWAEFDLEKKTWTIAADRTGNKSGVPWAVPLVDEVVAVLERRRSEASFVFPTRAGSKRTTAHRSQLTIDRVQERSGVIDFRPHDLRRTLNTWLASLAGGAVPQPVRDAILGHRPPRLEGTYNVHAYEKEKRKALERWARHVARCVAERSSNVVEFPGAS